MISSALNYSHRYFMLWYKETVALYMLPIKTCSGDLGVFTSTIGLALIVLYPKHKRSNIKSLRNHACWVLFLCRLPNLYYGRVVQRVSKIMWMVVKNVCMKNQSKINIYTYQKQSLLKMRLASVQKGKREQCEVQQKCKRLL